MDDFWGEVVYAYTVKDAEEDGVHFRVNDDPQLAEVAAQHYRFPVFITNGLREVIARTVEADESKDPAGILHDILFVSRIEGQKGPARPDVDFRLIIGQEVYDLRGVCQPYDPPADPSPVIVFCLASED